MSVKGALLNYLNKYLDWHEKKFGRRSIEENIPDIMYDGASEILEGFGFWKPFEIKEIYDFKSLEDKIGFTIHNDLKEYLTSYYFLRTCSKIGEFLVSFDPLTPKTNPLGFIYMSVITLKKNGFDPQYIDFAYADIDDSTVHDYLVLFHNMSGKIYCQKLLTNNSDERVYLAESMEEFLNKLAASFDNL